MTLPFAFAAALLVSGCSKQAPQQAAQPPAQPAAAPADQSATLPPPPPPQGSAPAVAPSATSAAAPPPATPSERRRAHASGSSSDDAAAPAAAPANYTIPAGTHISITTTSEISSKTSQPGQTFTATVASPVVVGGRTLIRSGSRATGTVVGTLSVKLDSVTSGGQSYDVESSTVDQVQKGKGKRTAVLTGGGAGAGALIGGLAGGGKGALLGGLLGGGGGAAGSAFTGNKEITIPAETTLTFRLENSVTVRR